MEVINEILIHMNILLMTSDVFLHWKKHFQIISNGNFLYFYFCKGWDACRFFLHNQRNTNICICMAFRERLGLTQYLGVHKLCKKTPVTRNLTFERRARQSASILDRFLTKIPNDLPASLFSAFIVNPSKEKKNLRWKVARGKRKNLHRPTFQHATEFSSQNETDTTVTSQGRSEGKNDRKTILHGRKRITRQ